MGAVDDVAAEERLVHGAVLDKRLGRVGGVNHVEMQGVPSQNIRLPHPVKLHPGKAPNGTGPHHLHVTTKSSEVLVAAGVGRAIPGIGANGIGSVGGVRIVGVALDQDVSAHQPNLGLVLPPAEMLVDQGLVQLDRGDVGAQGGELHRDNRADLVRVPIAGVLKIRGGDEDGLADLPVHQVLDKDDGVTLVRRHRQAGPGREKLHSVDVDLPGDSDTLDG